MASFKDKLKDIVKDNFKLEDKGEPAHNPWLADKALLMQETRCFHDANVDVPKCSKLITKVLYMLSQGETIDGSDLTDIFFGITKLFQVQNRKLRRLVYLMLKHLEPSETEVFIVTACLTKDMQSTNDNYRANAIRVLGRILDPSMAAQIDRYLKTAIIDKCAFVSSAALVCGMSLMPAVPDLVKRWVNECQQAAQNCSASFVQYHSLVLLHEVKKADKLALNKLITQQAKAKMPSVMAVCMLIRYAADVLSAPDHDVSIEKPFLEYLDGALKHRSEMVSFEAAKALAELASLNTNSENAGTMSVLGMDCSNAVTVLQILCSSSKPVARFGGIRVLNELAKKRPVYVAKCNNDVETLLCDSNRNIVTISISFLLKTAYENRVEKHIKQISGFMGDLDDIFKLDVVLGVRSLCLRYPKQFKVLMGFLATQLREEGTVDFKTALVDAIVTIVDRIPASRDLGLLQLCEFIEDCEYPALSSNILSFLAENVPFTSQPSKYIRFIYNRMILENAGIRAAAADCLTRIAKKYVAHTLFEEEYFDFSVPILRDDILILLEGCLADPDDEARDRIALFYRTLELVHVQKESQNAENALTEILSPSLDFSIDALYDSLVVHLASQGAAGSFDIAVLPTDDEYQDLQVSEKPRVLRKEQAHEIALPEKEWEKTSLSISWLEMVLPIVSMQALGELQHSGKPLYLTETEAEYTVRVTKHIFKSDYVILEFNVTNTIPDVTLANVNVSLSIPPSGGGAYEEAGSIGITSLKPLETASAFSVLHCRKNFGFSPFYATMQFLVQEEGDDIGFPDDFPLENFTLSLGDFMAARGQRPGNFKTLWNMLETSGFEATEKLSFPEYRSIEVAVKGLMASLNMAPCDGSEELQGENKGHSLLLAGTFSGGVTVLAKVLLAVSEGRVLSKIVIRTKQEGLPEMVIKSLQ